MAFSLAGGPLTVTEVALSALMKTLLASGVFWLPHQDGNMTSGPDQTDLLCVDRIELLLDFICSHIWQHMSPSVWCARVCQVTRLQILRYLIDQNTKAERLSHNLGSSKREVCHGGSH